MSTENEIHNDAAEQAGDHVAGETNTATKSRRKLVKAGLVAAPLLVTLRSRPLYAQSSLGSLGISYGLYTPSGGAGVVNEDYDPNADPNDPNEAHKVDKIKPDPNGPDRRPNTNDGPGGSG